MGCLKHANATLFSCAPELRCSSSNAVAVRTSVSSSAQNPWLTGFTAPIRSLPTWAIAPAARDHPQEPRGSQAEMTKPLKKCERAALSVIPGLGDAITPHQFGKPHKRRTRPVRSHRLFLAPPPQFSEILWIACWFRPSAPAIRVWNCMR